MYPERIDERPRSVWIGGALLIFRQERRRQDCLRKLFQEAVSGGRHSEVSIQC